MIGKLRHRVEIWKVTETDDGQGGATETESMVCETWGDIKQFSGLRAINYKQTTNETGYSLTLRYRSDTLDENTNFIKYKGTSYIFDSIINKDERSYLYECIIRQKR